MKRSTPSAVCTACGGDANPAELKLKIESVDRKLKVATVIDLSQSDESEDQDLLPLEWVQGVVVAQMYRDDTMPQGMVAPYQIQLDEDGCLIWARELSTRVSAFRGVSATRSFHLDP